MSTMKKDIPQVVADYMVTIANRSILEIKLQRTAELEICNKIADEQLTKVNPSLDAISKYIEDLEQQIINLKAAAPIVTEFDPRIHKHRFKGDINYVKRLEILESFKAKSKDVNRKEWAERYVTGTAMDPGALEKIVREALTAKEI